MEVKPDQYHPFEYCVLFRAGINPHEFVAREVSRLLQADAAKTVETESPDAEYAAQVKHGG